MRDTDMVVVLGSGERFHDAYQDEPGGPWHAACGNGYGDETWMPAWQAMLTGWTPCKRCFGWREETP